MHYIVETPEKTWRLVKDRSPTGYDEQAGRYIVTGVDYVTLAEGDADDMLLLAAGMNLYGHTQVIVLTMQAYDMLIEKRQAEVEPAPTVEEAGG